MVNVGINGMGRIGSRYFRLADSDEDINIVAINEPLKTLEHLHYNLKYDSVFGMFGRKIGYEENEEMIGGLKSSGYIITEDDNGDEKEVLVFNEMDAEKLPWKELGVDIVVDCSGKFRNPKDAAKHLYAGARKVVVSAPLKGRTPETVTIVYGVNENEYVPEKHKIISVASCTTNCAVPVAYVLKKEFGMDEAYISAIHGYTPDQKLTDAGHPKDMARGRAAAVNIVITATGAAKLTGEILDLGDSDGTAFRVPVPDGSFIDLVGIIDKKCSKEDINDALEEAAKNYLKGIMDFTMDPITSADTIGNPHSSIVIGRHTQRLQRLVSVKSGYDNEGAPSERLRDVTKFLL
jgi:glyceraldehyde-3-phosphate dehydrogenase type I